MPYKNHFGFPKTVFLSVKNFCAMEKRCYGYQSGYGHGTIYANVEKYIGIYV